MPNNNDITLLHQILLRIPVSRRINIAVLTDEKFLFCYKGNVMYMVFAQEHGPVEGLNFERGRIMDFFTQIELIINQIVSIHLKISDEALLKFEQLLDCADLFSKIKLLKDWDVIDNRTKDDLICLKEVRNGFAHAWEIEKVRYRGNFLTQNFEAFKSDSQRTFTKLLELYNGGPIDLTQVIEDLENTTATSSEATV